MIDENDPHTRQAMTLLEHAAHLEDARTLALALLLAHHNGTPWSYSPWVQETIVLNLPDQPDSIRAGFKIAASMLSRDRDSVSSRSPAIPALDDAGMTRVLKNCGLTEKDFSLR